MKYEIQLVNVKGPIFVQGYDKKHVRGLLNAAGYEPKKIKAVKNEK